MVSCTVFALAGALADTVKKRAKTSNSGIGRKSSDPTRLPPGLQEGGWPAPLAQAPLLPAADSTSAPALGRHLQWGGQPPAGDSHLRPQGLALGLWPVWTKGPSEESQEVQEDGKS